MEILVYYVVPNVALFGGIYMFAKVCENAAWKVIINYDRLVDKLVKQ